MEAIAEDSKVGAAVVRSLRTKASGEASRLIRGGHGAEDAFCFVGAAAIKVGAAMLEMSARASSDMPPGAVSAMVVLVSVLGKERAAEAWKIASEFMA